MAKAWFIRKCGCESVLITVLAFLSSILYPQEDLDIAVPRYFLSERSEESRALKTMLVDIVTKVRERESDDVSVKLFTCPGENLFGPDLLLKLTFITLSHRYVVTN